MMALLVWLVACAEPEPVVREPAMEPPAAEPAASRAVTSAPAWDGGPTTLRDDQEMAAALDADPATYQALAVRYWAAASAELSRRGVVAGAHAHGPNDPFVCTDLPERVEALERLVVRLPGVSPETKEGWLRLAGDLVTDPHACGDAARLPSADGLLYYAGVDLMRRAYVPAYPGPGHLPFRDAQAAVRFADLADAYLSGGYGLPPYDPDVLRAMETFGQWVLFMDGAPCTDRLRRVRAAAREHGQEPLISRLP